MAFLASGGASDSCHQQCGGHSCLATETGTMAFLASGGASDSSWSSPFTSFRRSVQQRTVDQTVDRSACRVVRSDRGRAHSPDSGACLGAGRRTDRRSGSAPDLRVQALPTVVHRPAESVSGAGAA